MGQRMTVKKGATVLWWSRLESENPPIGASKYVVAYHGYAGHAAEPKGWIVQFLVTPNPRRLAIFQVQFTGTRYETFRRDVAEYAAEYPAPPLAELPRVCIP